MFLNPFSLINGCANKGEKPDPTFKKWIRLLFGGLVMSRRMSREHAIQALYECEFHPDQEEQVLQRRGSNLEGDDSHFYFDLVRGVRGQQAAIDPVIKRFLKDGWSLNRISTVDRAILRLAVYELLFQPETPQGAILNEAVDLGKFFSSEESSRFINGVLGMIVKELNEIKKEIE